MPRAVSTDCPTVVRASELVAPAGAATPGLSRRQAFAGEGRWVGITTREPGLMSGWHEHGDNETFFFMLQGAIALKFGREGKGSAVAREGDSALVPPHFAHREGTAPPGPAAAVVLRVGRGPMVVPLDGPSADEAASPQIVSSDHLVQPAETTPGVERMEAFATGTAWFGRVRNGPKQASIWHVHPNHDTYGHPLVGRFFADFGRGGRERVVAGPGDFIEIPRGVVHREGNPDDALNDGIILRVGSGQVIVNLDGPLEG